ncbi:autophagy protein 13 [Onygenales sp. PD_40]|nr:autophagy protein 13 [Onygenales sp. PD_40]
MHQNPRPSPATASPASSPRTNPARTNNMRDRNPDPNSPQAEVGPFTTTGLGIEQVAELFEQGTSSTAPAREVVAKLNQIVQQYHTKAALIILQSRVHLPPSYGKDSDIKRFNVELDETDVLREDLRTWKNCDSTDHRPPPMIIETYLDPEELTQNQSLVILDDRGKRHDVLGALAASLPYRGSSQDTRYSRVILERWRVELGDSSSGLPADLGSILPALYKKSIILFRSLFTYSRFLPAWKFSKRQTPLRSKPALPIHYRIYEGKRGDAKPGHDPLTVPFYEDEDKPTEHFSFGVTESPAGPFSVQVTYRMNCDFRVDDSEQILSSRFMGVDENFFRPSLPSEDHFHGAQEVGSLPVTRRDINRPDNAQAYGSLSTFHHVEPATGVSPLSALRAARDLGNGSPGSPMSPPSPKHIQAARGAYSAQRKPSISFPPFKAPTLSASPSPADPPVGSYSRNASSRTGPINVPSSSKAMPPPASAASVSRKSTYVFPDNAIASSASASPRPAPISKYTSSFTHRRGRLSSGGASKTDDDNTSSGKASATSSTAQPSSGIIAEPGASPGSLPGDEGDIGDFLKMLDLSKDLLNPSDSAALDATTRRTNAALSRFQKMRDSNAALSDSMSSSLVLHRSSTTSSRQLPSVPPMVAGTSISTASSPGKPISPHTPHTPAIPSRLSSNSIIDYSHPDRPDTHRHRLSHESHGSPVEEATTSEETTMEPAPSSNVNAIDIPTSPRPFIPNYRRSSSAAQRRSTATLEDESGDYLPFGMRSLSLGAEDRSTPSVSALVRQQESANDNPAPDLLQPNAPQPAENDSNPSEVSTSGQYPAPSNRPYQPRFSHHRGRGSTSVPHSHNSASSSLGRGNTLATQVPDNDRDNYQGSGSNSGTYPTPDSRRGFGSGSVQRFGLYTRHHGPPSSNVEEDEPLLFTMSDFSVTRASLDGGRRGSGGGDSSAQGSGGNGSRRGSRRGPSGGGGYCFP